MPTSSQDDAELGAELAQGWLDEATLADHVSIRLADTLTRGED